MSTRQPVEINDIAQFFLVPGNTTHRQYEALRAYFVEGLPSAEAAKRFGYSKGSFQVLCSKFRNNPHRNFFLTPSKGPKSSPKRDRLHDDVIKLRKQNLSVYYDISEALKKEGNRLSPAAIDKILKKEGFARLPKRSDDERPNRARPTAADVADVRELDLTPRQFRTRLSPNAPFSPSTAAVLTPTGIPNS